MRVRSAEVTRRVADICSSDVWSSSVIRSIRLVNFGQQHTHQRLVDITEDGPEIGDGVKADHSQHEHPDKLNTEHTAEREAGQTQCQPPPAAERSETEVSSGSAQGQPRSTLNDLKPPAILARGSATDWTLTIETNST